MRILYSFFSGFLATLLFHQPALWVLNVAGITERAPYAMEGTWPFGVPAFLSLAFWGGVWGIVLWLLIRGWRGNRYWVAALLFGAIARTLVAGLVVAPLKGQPIAGGGDPSVLLMGIVVNAAWGIGTALLLRLLIERAGAPASSRAPME